MVLLAAVTLPPTFLTDLLLKKLSWSVESLFLGIKQIVDLATRKVFAFSRFILLFQPDGGIIHWQNYSEIQMQHCPVDFKPETVGLRGNTKCFYPTNYGSNCI